MLTKRFVKSPELPNKIEAQSLSVFVLQVVHLFLASVGVLDTVRSFKALAESSPPVLDTIAAGNCEPVHCLEILFPATT